MTDERAPQLVILAAGESRRLGTCKALVALSDTEPRTPLANLLRAGSCLASSAPIVVAGAHVEDLRRALAHEDAALHFNEDWRDGRTGGVLLAHRAAPDRDLCIAPVDVPLVSAQVFSDLAQAWRAAGAPARGWLAPHVRDWDAASTARSGFGHPIIIGRDLCRELRDLNRGAPLVVLRERAEPLLRIEVDDPAILDNLDAAADLELLRARILARSEKKSD